MLVGRTIYGSIASLGHYVTGLNAAILRKERDT